MESSSGTLFTLLSGNAKSILRRWICPASMPCWIQLVWNERHQAFIGFANQTQRARPEPGSSYSMVSSLLTPADNVALAEHWQLS